MRRDPRIVFAYLYGSALESQEPRDIDIAVYLARPEDPFRVAADLKVAISRGTGLPADRLDIRVIDNVDDLLYLRDVLNGRLLVDKDPELRGAFLESFAMKYRESEGILAEAYGP
ncbi:MAG: nucleotidyltransferase domain-containing protein [Nitrospirae bacterium]|nr:nucleotidyltransferase domain-containing protein [Nitrospirota bacterium]